MESPLTRPFRVHPPATDTALLRPEVLRRLLRRFEARLTIVRAGAGFGKTTALAQAVEQNLLAPRGHDRWIGCDPADADGDHLRRGIGESLGIVGEATTEAIAEAVASWSPAQVCLIFDDTHEIPADMPAIIRAIQAIQDYVAQNAETLQEVEINPLICTETDAIAADALIRTLKDPS